MRLCAPWVTFHMSSRPFPDTISPLSGLTSRLAAVLAVLLLVGGPFSPVVAADQPDIEAMKRELQEKRAALEAIEKQEAEAQQQAQETLRRTVPSGVADKIISGWKILMYYSLKGVSFAALLTDPVSGIKSLLTGAAVEELQFSQEELQFLTQKKQELERIKKRTLATDMKVDRLKIRREELKACIDKNQPAIAELDSQLQNLALLDRKANDLTKAIGELKKIKDQIVQHLEAAAKQTDAAEKAAEAAQNHFKKLKEYKAEEDKLSKQCGETAALQNRIEDAARKATSNGAAATREFDGIEQRIGKSCQVGFFLTFPPPSGAAPAQHEAWRKVEHTARVKEATYLMASYEQAKRYAAEAIVGAAKAQGLRNRMNKLVKAGTDAKSRWAGATQFVDAVGQQGQLIAQHSQSLQAAFTPAGTLVRDLELQAAKLRQEIDDLPTTFPKLPRFLVEHRMRKLTEALEAAISVGKRPASVVYLNGVDKYIKRMSAAESRVDKLKRDAGVILVGLDMTIKMCRDVKPLDATVEEAVKTAGGESAAALIWAKANATFPQRIRTCLADPGPLPSQTARTSAPSDHAGTKPPSLGGAAQSQAARSQAPPRFTPPAPALGPRKTEQPPPVDVASAQVPRFTPPAPALGSSKTQESPPNQVASAQVPNGATRTDGAPCVMGSDPAASGAWAGHLTHNGFNIPGLPPIPGGRAPLAFTVSNGSTIGGNAGVPGMGQWTGSVHGTTLSMRTSKNSNFFQEMQRTTPELLSGMDSAELAVLKTMIMQMDLDLTGNIGGTCAKGSFTQRVHVTIRVPNQAPVTQAASGSGTWEAKKR